MGIVSLFTTILNLILLHVLKIHQECFDSMVHEGLNTSICDEQMRLQERTTYKETWTGRRNVSPTNIAIIRRIQCVIYNRFNKGHH